MSKRKTAVSQMSTQRYKKRKYTPRKTYGYSLSGEMKYFDTELTASAIQPVTTTYVAGTRLDPSSTINLGSAAVATPLCLFAPTVGSALNQRVGRKAAVMKVKIKGTILIPPQSVQSAADASCKVRLVLLCDKQTNAAQYTASQVFNDATNANITIDSFQNPNGFGRFTIYKDKTFVMGNAAIANDTGSTGGIIQAALIRQFKMTVNFKNPLTVNFNATNGGTVADITDNSLHILCGCNNSALAPTLSYYARVSYKE